MHYFRRRAFTFGRSIRWQLSLALVALLLLGMLCPQAQAATLRFAIIGDFGSGDSYEADVAALVKSWAPEFIITTGDNNYPDGEASTIDAHIGQFYHQFIFPYSGTYGLGADINRFFPSLGNHDWNTPGAQPHLDYFQLPNNERYYDFVWGPVHCFAIDSDGHEPDGNTSTSIQGQWLRNRLAASTAKWKVVYFHHPPYSSRTSWPDMQWPFKEWGATIVVAGHAHVYERIMRDGFPYITNGLGGASRGSFSGAIEGSVVQFGSDFGAQLVTATETGISFKFYTRAGVLIDDYTIGTPIVIPAPSNLTATTLSASEIALSWADNSSNESGFKIERSTDGQIFTEIAQVGSDITSYTSSGLASSSTYSFRVRAYVGSDSSAYSNTATATTLPGPPAAPNGLIATGGSLNQISLSWTDSSSNEDAFEIERSEDGNSFQPIGAVGPDQTTYSDTGLPEGATRFYRVRAVNEYGGSLYSNIASATTAAIPAAPTNLTAAAVSSSQIALAWTDNANNEDGFRIHRSTDGVSFTLIKTMGANVTSYSDTGRSASTTYYYRVQAYNSTSQSDYTNTASATTLPAAGTPLAPSDLTATTVSSSQIALAWTDNANSEDGFRIHRSVDGITFKLMKTVGANVTSYSDTGRSASTTYYYRVQAYNASGRSAYTNVASASTLPPQPKPNAPSGLTATALSSSQIMLTWIDNSNNEDGFRIHRSTDGKSFTQIAKPGWNSTSFTDTGLLPATTYYYRVRAYNSTGDSAYLVVSRTTLP